MHVFTPKTIISLTADGTAQYPGRTYMLILIVMIVKCSSFLSNFSLRTSTSLRYKTCFAQRLQQHGGSCIRLTKLSQFCINVGRWGEVYNSPRAESGSVKARPLLYVACPDFECAPRHKRNTSICPGLTQATVKGPLSLEGLGHSGKWLNALGKNKVQVVFRGYSLTKQWHGDADRKVKSRKNLGLQ